MTNAIVKSFDDVVSISKAMAGSGYFKDSQDASQAIVKILAGQEIGMGPFASMTGIHIIQGKPVMGANVIATIIKNDPRYDYHVKELNDNGCVIDFFENGKNIGTSSFKEDDAKAAGLGGKDNWKKFPRNMYFARAISNGARWFTPGVFGGAPIYTPDEFDLDVDEDGGVVIDSTVEVIEPEVIEEKSEPEPKKKNGNGKRTWDGELVHAVVMNGLAQTPQHAVAMLNLSDIDAKNTTVEQVVSWAREYRGHKDEGLETDEAAGIANMHYRAMKEAE